MSYDFERIIAALHRHGVWTTLHEHPAVRTVEEMLQVCGDIGGTHTKNLFLRDAKKNFFLVTVPHEAQTDLKALRSLLGAKGALSFASAEALAEQLHVASGAVSPLAALNSCPGAVKVFLDASLLTTAVINIHPLTSDRTIAVRGSDLAAFLTAHGHPPIGLEPAFTGAPAQP